MCVGPCKKKGVPYFSWVFFPSPKIRVLARCCSIVLLYGWKRTSRLRNSLISLVSVIDLWETSTEAIERWVGLGS